MYPPAEAVSYPSNPYRKSKTQGPAGATFGLAYVQALLATGISNSVRASYWQKYFVHRIEARLRQTVTEAVATLENLKRLSAISAKSNYLTAAWSNRMGEPSAKDKQAVLDEVNKQLIDLKISEEERREITRPYVQMVGFDLYSIYVRVFDRYLSWKSQELMRLYNANNSPENKLALEAFRDKPGDWRSRSLGGRGIWQGLDSAKLAAQLENASPNAWLDQKELKAADGLKSEILRLFKECEIKMGYTPEAAEFYDAYHDSSGHDRKLIELFGVNPSEVR